MNVENIPLYDIYDVWHESLWRSPLFLIAISLGIVLVGIGIVIFWKKKKKQYRFQEPWVEAHEQLILLASLNIDNHDEYKKCYDVLSAIMKRYFMRRYGMVLHSATDQEVLTMLKKSELPQECLDLFSDIVNHARYARFAAKPVWQDQFNGDIQESIKIIECTVPAASEGLDTSDKLKKGTIL